MQQNYDIILVGGGIIGLTLARQIRKRRSDLSIAILEKEPLIGKHSSGRNSGVIHAGLYYPSGSLKARLCVEGARQLKAYCQEENLPHQDCGKVILPTEQNQDLDFLLERAQQNSVPIEKIDTQQLRELEPHARSITGQALFSPSTSIVDSNAVLKRLQERLIESDVAIHFNCELIRPIQHHSAVETTRGTFSYGHLINVAGLNADRIAHAYGVAKNYTMIPFKGTYYRLDPESGLKFQRLVYPLPDLRFPFLGVHVTPSVDGQVYLGPSALPALGRENYQWSESISIPELLRSSKELARQYLLNENGFRHYVHQEAVRFWKPQFLKATQELVPAIRIEHLLASSKVGIRAQLYDRVKKKLEMDFLFQSTDRSTHLLNVVSPGFTSSFRFAEMTLDEYLPSSI